MREELKNYQGAEADYTQLIRLKPNEAYVYNNRGLIRKELKNYKGTEVDFTQAIKLNPKDVDAYNNRSIVRKALKKYKSAEADLQVAARLQRQRNNVGSRITNVDTYIHRIIISSLNDSISFLNQRTEAGYIQVIELNPTAADAYTNRGLIRKELKKYKGAEADFTQAVKLFPDEANVYTNRGLPRIEAENYPGAITDLQKAAQLYR